MPFILNHNHFFESAAGIFLIAGRIKTDRIMVSLLEKRFHALEAIIP